MYSEIERLKGSTYEPSPENDVQFEVLIRELAKVNSEYLFETDLDIFDRDDIFALARDYEKIRALSMSLKRFAVGRLRRLQRHVKPEN